MTTSTILISVFNCITFLTLPVALLHSLGQSITRPNMVSSPQPSHASTVSFPCRNTASSLSLPPPPYLNAKADHQTQPSRPAKPICNLDAELFHPLIVARSTIYVTSFLSPPPPRHTPVQHRSTNHYRSASLLHAPSQEPITFSYTLSSNSNFFSCPLFPPWHTDIHQTLARLKRQP